MIVVISFTSAEFVNANTVTADTLRTTAVEQAAQDEKIKKALLYGLESEINGVLESTFYNTIAYKTLNPEFTSEELIEKITRIALDENKNSHVVRYKAFLTLSYLKDYDEFANNSEQLRNYVKANDKRSAFQVIVDNLRQQQVAAN